MSKTPSRFPNGVTNVGADHPLYKLGILSPILWQSYFNDFATFVADEWLATVVDTGVAGGAAYTIDATPGGVLNVLNNANALDSINLSLGGAGAGPFVLPAGKQCYLVAKFGATDALASFIALGLVGGGDVDLEGALPDDHVIVKVDAAAANIDLSVAKDGVATTQAAVGTLADYVEGTNNLVEVALYYNGDDKIEAFVDGAKVATLPTTNWPDDAPLTLAMEIHNSDATADALAVDYVFVAVER